MNGALVHAVFHDTEFCSLYLFRRLEDLRWPMGRLQDTSQRTAVRKPIQDNSKHISCATELCVVEEDSHRAVSWATVAGKAKAAMQHSAMSTTQDADAMNSFVLFDFRKTTVVSPPFLAAFSRSMRVTSNGPVQEAGVVLHESTWSFM